MIGCFTCQLYGLLGGPWTFKAAKVPNLQPSVYSKTSKRRSSPAFPSNRSASTFFQRGDGRRTRLSPLVSCSFVTCAHVIEDIYDSLPEPADPVSIINQALTSVPVGFLTPYQDAKGSHSWWMMLPPLDHLDTVMSSRLQHSASSIAILLRMEASTRGIALGSLHSSVRLHSSIRPQPPASMGCT